MPSFRAADISGAHNWSCRTPYRACRPPPPASHAVTTTTDGRRSSARSNRRRFSSFVPATFPYRSPFTGATHTLTRILGRNRCFAPSAVTSGRGRRVAGSPSASTLGRFRVRSRFCQTVQADPGQPASQKPIAAGRERSRHC